MKYFLGFLAAVGLVVLVFILVLRGLSGGHKQNVQTLLTDYTSTDTVMRLTIDGPVKADQNHQAVRITIGRDSNLIEMVKGYQGQVVNQQAYPNNEAAYGVFLRALQLNGYTKGNTDPEKADDRGVCASGYRYEFEIITGGSSVQRFWTTSCGGGTFAGRPATVRSLFRAQIPDYNKVTHGFIGQ